MEERREAWKGAEGGAAAAATGEEASRGQGAPNIKVEPGQEQCCASIAISERAKHTIELILEQIKSLSSIEKFLLFLKLPSEVTNAVDPFRQPLNPLGNRSEIYKTISWIRTHLEEDPDISLPKQEVYNDYFNHCEKSHFKPLSQADFGKVMKQVYPRVRARRLGTRGNSRYCYSGLRRCVKLRPPLLPDLTDKPMSTEAPFTQASLNSAAWLIVKDWSERQLGKFFPNIHSLAYHLILNHSISKGSEAASKITSAAESSSKDDNKVGNKHKEMQMQLQRKIQQKNEGKKRKIQSMKSDQRPSSKKSRSQSLPTAATVSPPIALSSIECNNNNNNTTTSSSGGGSSSSTSTSPTQGKPICDKTKEFSQLPSLPDFKSFQRTPATAVDNLAVKETSGATGAPASANKVPIPRLHPQQRHQQQQQQQQIAKQAKYKTPQQPSSAGLLSHCDIAPYNLRAQDAPEGNRSQQFHNDRIKDSNGDDAPPDECDVDAVLTRERINSVSNVDKDAMDEYLGTNNSQHEEELSKYFSNNNNNNLGELTDANAAPNNAHVQKLSTLRQLLERNSIVIENRLAAYDAAAHKIEMTYIAPTVDPTTTVKRRVSFDVSDEVAVPPSPNTRRRNFSFTPISPGPQSPNGVQSKCSSTTVSPFVSPRNTPVLKTAKKMTAASATKVKREIDLTIDIPQEGQFNYPMSAPASPMLKKLLNSGNKVTYNPGYGVQTVPSTPEVSQDMQQFFPTTSDAFRSQSAPLHQAAFRPLEETGVFDGLFEAHAPNDPFGGSVDELSMQLIDAMEANQFVHSYGRCNPSRSVPSTPVPFGQGGGAKGAVKATFNSSRSYPSTPLTSDEPFSYNVNNGDCLLNGQPIKTDGGVIVAGDELGFDMATATATGIPDFDVVEGQDFGAIIENDAALMENCVLMEQDYVNIN